jgi:hypothetical protein
MNHMNHDGNIINKCVTGSFNILQLPLQRHNARPYERIACDAKLFLSLDILTATYVGEITRETEQFELRNGRTTRGVGCTTCFAALSSI